MHMWKYTMHTRGYFLFTHVSSDCAQVAGARCLAVSSETVAVGGAQGVVRLLTHALAPKARSNNEYDW